MQAPAAFASDPTTQPAYRAQNRPEQGRPPEDRAWGFTPWGRPGNSPGHDRPSAHYRHWPFRCCSSPVTAPTNVAPLPERWTTNVAVQNWKSQATPRVIEPPTTPRPNRRYAWFYRWVRTLTCYGMSFVTWRQEQPYGLAGRRVVAAAHLWDAGRPRRTRRRADATADRACC